MRLIDADELKERLKEYCVDGDKGIEEYYEIMGIDDCIDNAPTVDAVEVVRCKDCKHFTLNLVENVGGIPLIVAHEVCSFWGDGCKTSQEGFCSFGERKENVD